MMNSRNTTTSLTILAYFAAKAPSDIPCWFKGVTPPLVAPSAIPPTEIREDIRHVLSAWLKDAADELSLDFLMEHPAAHAWYDSWKAYFEDVRDHSENTARARQAQWPWAWAKMVLAAEPAVEFV